MISIVLIIVYVHQNQVEKLPGIQHQPQLQQLCPLRISPHTTPARVRAVKNCIF
jgi:hypothetical protein